MRLPKHGSCHVTTVTILTLNQTVIKGQAASKAVSLLPSDSHELKERRLHFPLQSCPAWLCHTCYAFLQPTLCWKLPSALGSATPLLSIFPDPSHLFQLQLRNRQGLSAQGKGPLLWSLGPRSWESSDGC